MLISILDLTKDVKSPATFLFPIKEPVTDSSLEFWTLTGSIPASQGHIRSDMIRKHA